ncbi:uncharacterized protein LOC107804414 isoform X2 [Nicotiana tabacum]|uniref:acylphosphatase n=2 Tax=Nicotiana TaxID=4085 RepID=A0A1S4B4D1_TOBAC|nr:PREDICTED: uncharacterized protein LOC104232143 [Nicotiana sylvestris]XP_009783563.1 PREDICTED: uncharacterized protein LOC104232143 [Nicotiana sylvestris]XP_016483786.1 PREDICTED: acylphosphatase-like isoform X1 [Nicotiana tabacum]XP_016483787.1 PREDICTED: acylphosphatase-like isoform X1 [Nicotiana tabacum]
MALLSPSTSSCITNSLFKSHFIIRNHLEPPWQCQKRSLFILTENVTNIHKPTRVSFQLPPLLHLRLGLRFCSLPFSSRFLLPCTSLPLLRRLRSPHLSSPMSSLTSDQNSNATPDAKTVRAVIKGRVQGVFYRDWTVENAKELGLKGWVRNRRDGSVEALFSGSPEKVQEMEQRCRRGPPAAIVTGLDVFPCDDDPGTGFERRQTG